MLKVVVIAVALALCGTALGFSLAACAYVWFAQFNEANIESSCTTLDNLDPPLSVHLRENSP
jgi:hypothetical protein